MVLAPYKNINLLACMLSKELSHIAMQSLSCSKLVQVVLVLALEKDPMSI